MLYSYRPIITLLHSWIVSTRVCNCCLIPTVDLLYCRLRFLKWCPIRELRVACSQARDRRLHVGLVHTFCVELFYIHVFCFDFRLLGSSAILPVSGVLVVSFVSGSMNPESTYDGCDDICSWTDKGSLVIERLPVRRLPVIKLRFARDQPKLCPRSNTGLPVIKQTFARDRTLEHDRANFCPVLARVQTNATLARDQAIVLLIAVRSIFLFFSGYG